MTGSRKAKSQAATGAQPEPVCKKPKLMSGNCKCSACGASSKDSWKKLHTFGKPIIVARALLDKHDVTLGFPCELPRVVGQIAFGLGNLAEDVGIAGWALRAQGKNSTETCLGDKCDKCFQLWTKCYDFLSWDTFSSRCQDSKNVTFQESLKEATQNLEDITQRTFRASTVETGLQSSVLITRHFLALTEKDLRKITNKEKISKADVASLPCLHGKDIHGQVEDYFLFKDPDHPYRTAQLQTSMASALSTPTLSSSLHCWQGQEEAQFQHTTTQALTDAGVANVMARESCWLSIPDFLEQKQKKAEKEADELEASEVPIEALEGLGVDEDEGDVDQQVSIVGAAAAVHMKAQKLARSASSNSVGDSKGMKKFVTPTQQGKKKAIGDAQSVLRFDEHASCKSLQESILSDELEPGQEGQIT
eukprot:6492614-Amphidinium_carterae.4